MAYVSKTLSKTERNYCLTRRELMSIMKILEHFHKHVYEQEFYLRTDHSVFTWLLNFRTLERQTARRLCRSTASHLNTVKA